MVIHDLPASYATTQMLVDFRYLRGFSSEDVTGSYSDDFFYNIHRDVKGKTVYFYILIIQWEI